MKKEIKKKQDLIDSESDNLVDLEVKKEDYTNSPDYIIPIKKSKKKSVNLISRYI